MNGNITGRSKFQKNAQSINILRIFHRSQITLLKVKNVEIKTEHDDVVFVSFFSPPLYRQKSTCHTNQASNVQFNGLQFKVASSHKQPKVTAYCIFFLS